MAKNSCPSSSSSAGRLRQEPSMAKNCWSSSSLSSGRLRQEPSKLKSGTQVARELPPSPQGTTASTTPPFVRAGYDCQNNTTVHGDAQKPWGGHPSCDPAPLTTSFGTVGQWERRHRAMVERTKGRRPKKPTVRHKGAATPKKPTNERRNSSKQLGGRGEGTREPWRRGATVFCKLSRQLLVRLNEHTLTAY